MKAAVYYNYGRPEVVSIQDVPNPIPSKNEMLIKVYASTVNRTDAGFRSAEYFISRFWSGLFKPKFTILGCEYAGEVIETGAEISLFKKGDRVFGYNDIRFGGHAEFITAKETDGIAKIPEGMPYTTAAALTEGSHYALNNIKLSRINPGENALVYGATGAIGSSAVQLLKYFKANVTAVVNTKNINLVKSLGADTVIDYQNEDFTRTNKKFKFVFDAVGKTSFFQCKPLMDDNSIFISTELGKYGSNVFLALARPFMSSKKVLFPIPKTEKKDIEFLASLAMTGNFTPVIDRVYCLDEIVAAYKYVDSGQKTGNVIIEVCTSA